MNKPDKVPVLMTALFHGKSQLTARDEVISSTVLITTSPNVSLHPLQLSRGQALVSAEHSRDFWKVLAIN